MLRKMTRLLVFATLVAFAVALPSCNTVEGLGEDIGDAGDGISNASRDVRDDDAN